MTFRQVFVGIDKVSGQLVIGAAPPTGDYSASEIIGNQFAIAPTHLNLDFTNYPVYIGLTNGALVVGVVSTLRHNFVYYGFDDWWGYTDAPTLGPGWDSLYGYFAYEPTGNIANSAWRPDIYITPNHTTVHMDVLGGYVTYSPSSPSNYSGSAVYPLADQASITIYDNDVNDYSFNVSFRSVIPGSFYSPGYTWWSGQQFVDTPVLGMYSGEQVIGRLVGNRFAVALADQANPGEYVVMVFDYGEWINRVIRGVPDPLNVYYKAPGYLSQPPVIEVHTWVLVTGSYPTTTPDIVDPNLDPFALTAIFNNTNGNNTPVLNKNHRNPVRRAWVPIKNCNEFDI